jgi:hypothetical protein
MAKLSSAGRKALPKSEFAGPNRSYPVPDKSHARNALARASQAVHEGRMSESTKEKIDMKADKVLHGHGGKHETNSRPGGHVGGQMDHEMHTVSEDNVLHTMHMTHGATHPDSKGGKGMHGDGKGHWSGH